MRRIIAMWLFTFLIFWLSSSSVHARSGPVSIEFFGLHIHRADQGTAWPNVPFGSWRLWDAYVTWADIEPVRGKWNFARLDRDVDLAKQHNVEILLPLANTPAWSAARPNEPSVYKPGNASEPANIEDWRRYVRTVGERYKGRIRYYEIWNEPNHKHHFSGSIANLVELTCEAFRVLKSIDPLNQVVSPAAGTGAKDHFDYLDRFLSSGGKNCIDIVGYHFYVTRYGPEAMVPLIREVHRLMEKNSIGKKPLWNTETGWRFGNEDGAPDHQMVKNYKKISLDGNSNFVLRTFALSRAEGIGRFFWYSWDNPYGLGMIDTKSGKPKRVAEQWRDAVDRLLGASNVRCSNDGNRWRCSFVRSDGSVDQFSWTAE